MSDQLHPAIMIHPSYNKLSERIRKMAPPEVICQMFCGGKKCKYDNSRWAPTDMAIDGIFSHWITENLLAMARPHSEVMAQKGVIDQFISLGIKTIINLQMSGEHGRCGPPLTETGFTYQPETFMENDIYFYNFGWKDYGQPSLQSLLNVVKVVAFAQSQGKVAVHCHAGRTGFLMACYLIYNLRVKANDAIRYVRAKRPRSLQTRSQIQMTQEFEHFLLPLSQTFCIREFVRLSQQKKYYPFTLNHHLKCQQAHLHGNEARSLRYIPKILYVVCERLIILCQERGNKSAFYSLNFTTLPFSRSFYCSRFDRENGTRLPHQFSSNRSSIISSGVLPQQRAKNEVLVMTDIHEDNSSEARSSEESKTPSALSYSGTLNDLLDQEIFKRDLSANECYQELECNGSQPDLDIALQRLTMKISADDVIAAILGNPDDYKEHFHPIIKDYCLQLNGRSSVWIRLATENQPETLVILMWSWLIHLKVPILSNEELSQIVVYFDAPDVCFSKFDQAARYTIEYILRFVYRMFSRGDQRGFTDSVCTAVLKRLAGVLTHQAVEVNGVLYPIVGRVKRLGLGTLENVLTFFRRALELIEEMESQSQVMGI